MNVSTGGGVDSHRWREPQDDVVQIVRPKKNFRDKDYDYEVRRIIWLMYNFTFVSANTDSALTYLCEYIF